MASWDVIVVGGGPAGLMAACRAAERGRNTLLLEKRRQTGSKILLSGGTRCNLTHATDRRGIVRGVRPAGPIPPFGRWPPWDRKNSSTCSRPREWPPRSRPAARSFLARAGPPTSWPRLLARLRADRVHIGSGRAGRRNPPPGRGLRRDHIAADTFCPVAGPGHRRPVVSGQRLDRRRLSLGRRAGPHDRHAAARPGADHHARRRGAGPARHHDARCAGKVLEPLGDSAGGRGAWPNSEARSCSPISALSGPAVLDVSRAVSGHAQRPLVAAAVRFPAGDEPGVTGVGIAGAVPRGRQTTGRGNPGRSAAAAIGRGCCRAGRPRPRIAGPPS